MPQNFIEIESKFNRAQGFPNKNKIGFPDFGEKFPDFGEFFTERTDLMDKIYYEIDQETGELKETTDRLVVLNEGDIVRRKKQLEYYSTVCKAQSDNGNFVWFLFQYGENIFPNVSAANLTRLMYAATFCNKDGSIMDISSLKKKMNLNKNRWSEFWNEMMSNNILYESDSMVYINQEIFFNGKIDTDKNYTRLFCEYVRLLYEGCSSANDHKQLSYIFKMIPFVNRRTNIVCKNQTDQNESNIIPMRIAEFCDVIGYNKTHARRLVRDLLKIRINGELAVGFFVSDLDEKTWMLVLNPKLCFGGKYDEMFEKYRNLFTQEAKKIDYTIQN